MTRKGRRLVLIGSALGVGIAACLLILFALRDSIVFFYSPSEVVAKDLAPGTRVRLGGLVEVGTVDRQAGGLVTFRVTDNTRDLPVRYTGLLPDLFREGQGVVAEGAIDGSGMVVADTILAKHDERYMPRDVADKLKKEGLWQGQQAKAPDKGSTQAASTAVEAVTIR